MLARRLTIAPAALSRGILASAAGQPPLSEQFPGVADAPTQAAQPRTGAHKTTLSNGVKVVTHGPKQPAAAVRVSVAAGSRYETAATAGVSRYLKHLAFASTNKRSAFRVWRDIEGACPSDFGVDLGREEVTFHAKVLPDAAPELVDVVSDVLFNGKYAYHEVRDYKAKLRADVFGATAAEQLSDAVFTAAYGYQGLGRPKVATPASINKINGDSVAQFVSAQYQPSNVTVVASGVDHDEFVGAIKASIGAAAATEGAASASAPSVYRGGQVQVPEDVDGFHFAIAFDGTKAKPSAQAVLAKLLGGGSLYNRSSQSVDSLIHKNLVATHKGLSAGAFHKFYSDAGLFGIEVHLEDASQAASAVVAAVEQFNEAAKVSADDLARAKRQAKADYLFAHDGAHYAESGAASTDAHLKAIDAVTDRDIKDTLAALKTSKLSLGTVGIADIPHVDELAARL